MSSHRVAGHQRELLMIQEGPRLAQGKSPRGGQGWPRSAANVSFRLVGGGSGRTVFSLENLTTHQNLTTTLDPGLKT